MTDAPRDLDVALIGQDPRFGGGFRSFATAFWHASLAIGRRPQLFFLSRGDRISLFPPSVSRLRARRELIHEPFDATALPSTLPELDALNQLLGGPRIARRARRARTVWVVATTAPYGFAALLTGRPYSCWLATGLESEWRARRAGLSPMRRVALAINRPVLRVLERLVIRRARRVFAISPASRESVAAAAGLPTARIGLLPIPVATNLFTPRPEEEWLASLAAPVLAFLGRGSDPRKNLALLADAMPLIRRELPGARLRVIGERPLPDVVRRLSDEDEVLGPLNDVVEPLRTSTLFVLPSLQEGFGIVVAEALACGVPAVVTPSGGPEELVHASSGGIVLRGFDAEELASTVVSLVRDPDRLRGMRRDGRAYVEREHGPERLEELLVEAYRELDARD